MILMLLLNSEGSNTSYKDICYIPIGGYKGSRTYIVSYGPTKALKDIAFWKEIWELQCEIIVMITTVHDSEEINDNKIQRVLEDVHFVVIIEQGQSWVNYTKRPVKILMNQEKSPEGRIITLFEFYAWPTNVGIPDNIESFLEFHKKVEGSKTNLNGPTLVHCSAGFRRCGTYVAFDMLQKNASRLTRNDVGLCLHHLENCRIKTTPEQIDDLFQMFATPRLSQN